MFALYFHDIWCIKSLFSSKYMYASSLLTLLPFYLWITYGNFYRLIYGARPTDRFISHATHDGA